MADPDVSQVVYREITKEKPAFAGMLAEMGTSVRGSAFANRDAAVEIENLGRPGPDQ
jgi:hypothetical protein